MVRSSGTCFGRNLCPAWWQHLWPPAPHPCRLQRGNHAVTLPREPDPRPGRLGPLSSFLSTTSPCSIPPSCPLHFLLFGQKTGSPAEPYLSPRNCFVSTPECGVCVSILPTFVKLVRLAYKWCWMFFGLCFCVRSIHYPTCSSLSLLACPKRSDVSLLLWKGFLEMPKSQDLIAELKLLSLKLCVSHTISQLSRRSL